MMVVAIIGVLASIAIPAYQNYVAKSILTSLHASASGGRTAMLSRYMEMGEMPIDGTGTNGVREQGSATEGLFTSLNASLYQSAVSYTKNGSTKATILVTLDNVNGNVNTKTLSFEFEDDNGSLTMKCVAHAQLDKKYVPKSCQ